MKFSNAFIKTQKEAPQDATLLSHSYLIRAGYIEQLASGFYHILPLGKRVIDKISAIIRSELERANIEEISMPCLCPASLWEQTKRYQKYGKELFCLQDRKENPLVLSPTHEEAVTQLVAKKIKSYKDLPIHLYQMTPKFRDELRPRSGLLRAREFVMKDSYSFHANKEDLDKEFKRMQEVYETIFNRLNLDYRVVEADSGAIGGSGSKEFMALCESGEDLIAICDSCSYAANVESARKKSDDFSHALETSKIHTPGIKTIDALSTFLNLPKTALVKAVVKRAIFDDKDEIICFFVRGDDELEPTKAKNACGALDLVDLESQNDLALGFVGFNNLLKKAYFDEVLNNGGVYITGANEKDYHEASTLPSEAHFVDLARVRDGDSCLCGNGKLHLTKGIEGAHIFKLGNSYAQKLDAKFLDTSGKTQFFEMGCYGMGVSRLLGVIAEQSHDDRGLIFAPQIAPFLIDIIVENIKDDSQMSYAQDLYNALKSQGVNVILDDRKERFGFKMKDYELLGIPYGVIIGKAIIDNEVELFNRATLEKTKIHTKDIEEKCLQL